jgi:hypothetical protein
MASILFQIIQGESDDIWKIRGTGGYGRGTRFIDGGSTRLGL